MSNVLITGASGFIGHNLAGDMSADHTVVCLSRAPTEVAGVHGIEGDFTEPDDLCSLDGHPLDVIIHLGAVTGGCTEESGLRVNVSGAHHVLRYGIGRGVKKFVLASSIAVVGFQSLRFRPLKLPMPDDHPCLDRDGYGLSKYLMEEVTRYLVRQNDDLDIINIRLASIMPEESKPTPCQVGPLTEWAIGSLAKMYQSDAVRCFRMAAEAPHKSGVRILNAVGGQACTAAPVPDIIRGWYGADADRIDLSHYERPGHERDPVYDIRLIEREIGFVPQRSVLGEEA